MKKQELQKKNAIYLEGNTNKNIREVHAHVTGLNLQIDTAQKVLQNTLKKDRDKILEVLSKKIDDINETFRKKEAEKKDSMYDIKQKEKELTEALETFTQVA